MAANDDKPKGKTTLSAEERKQLLVHHMSHLRAKQAEVNELREPLKAAQEEFTALVNEAKADLGKGYTRKHLVSLLEDSTSRLRDLMKEEEQRAFDREALGLPVFGIQADLFGDAATKMPDEARDELQYEAEGYMRGRAGLLQEIPDGTPPRFHQAVMKGYERGQEQTRADFIAGAEIRKAQAEPDADVEPENLDIEDALDPDVIDDAAKKLKKSDFMARGEPAAAVA